MDLLSNIVMKFSKISKTKPRCHSVGNLPKLKVLSEKRYNVKKRTRALMYLGTDFASRFPSE